MNELLWFSLGWFSFWAMKKIIAAVMKHIYVKQETERRTWFVDLKNKNN